MPNVKTAISIPQELFKEVDRYSRRNKVPRSQIFAKAVRKWLRQVKDEAITAKLNEVYADAEVDEEQRAFARAAMASWARQMGNEKW